MASPAMARILRPWRPAQATFVVLVPRRIRHGRQALNQNLTGRPPCCFQPRSPAPCRSRNGWPSPTRCGRPGSRKGDELARAKRDATLLAVKLQEDAGIDIVTEGEQARQHFVHGFLEKIEGIDFAHKVEMGIRNDRYKAMVPQVVAPLRLKGRVHADEARVARTHTTRKLKFTLPGPMTIIDTIADNYYGDRVKMAFAFAELLNEEAKALQADGVDVIQFDEPAFNVYMDEVRDWGIKALERAAEGLTCATAVHICYGYGIKANTDWKETLGGEWRQYEEIFPAIAKSPIQQVAIECRNSQGAAGTARPAQGQGRAGRRDRRRQRHGGDRRGRGQGDRRRRRNSCRRATSSPTTNCGMAPMRREIAEAKLMALGAGARLARQKLGMMTLSAVSSPPRSALRRWSAAMASAGARRQLAPSSSPARPWSTARSAQARRMPSCRTSPQRQDWTLRDAAADASRELDACRRSSRGSEASSENGPRSLSLTRVRTPRSDAAPADIPPRTRARVEGGVSSMASSAVAARRAIARRRPSQRPAARDQKALVVHLHHRAVGQSLPAASAADAVASAALAAARGAAPRRSRARAPA